MRLSGRLSAAIDVLADFEARRVPLKTAIADWARGARYAGAKDRAWISGLCLDALRKRHSLAFTMESETPRALALGALRYLWERSVEELTDAAAEEPHGPGALSEEEVTALSSQPFVLAKSKSPWNAASDPHAVDRSEIPPSIVGDFPEWLTPHVERVFGVDSVAAMQAFAERADIDLRINTLKATREQALSALKAVKGEPAPILESAARIKAPDPSEKAPAVTVIPAFNKGWVEVQDLGSQIAAAAAGAVKGEQVLDYCAGGGGKTLALAALMENTGQLYAYDRDARRLKPLYDRARRAGVRNLQILNPQTDEAALDALAEKMDVVFVDAPCTGSGTWRRRPDTKWRLTENQLSARIGEQDEVLREAARFVRPGGGLVWVTCSFLAEENEDRLAAFLGGAPEFSRQPVLEAVRASGLTSVDGLDALQRCVSENGDLRITPDRIRADGFFVATLLRRS